MSPSSVFTVLAMLQTGAKGETLKQMTKALCLTETDSQSLLALLKTFNTRIMQGSKEVILAIANRLYPNAEHNLVDEYATIVINNFQTDSKPLEFRNDPEGCRKEINDWVETATHHKIKNILPSGSVTADTGMVVVNAIYFKGKWVNQFEKDDTQKEDFHEIGGRTTKVDMMRKKIRIAEYQHHTDLQCKVLRLWYSGGDIAMVVILPDAVDGLPKLEAALNVFNLQKLVTKCSIKTVDVCLPKFKIETGLEMKKTLQIMGMLDLFNMTKADLTGIGEQLFVSDLFHKTYVAVDENGTEAAAATSHSTLLCCYEEKEFRADKPFMFLIWDFRVNVPLFMGRFVKA